MRADQRMAVASHFISERDRVDALPVRQALSRTVVRDPPG
jgi:hypothetical protein